MYCCNCCQGLLFFGFVFYSFSFSSVFGFRNRLQQWLLIQLYVRFICVRFILLKQQSCIVLDIYIKPYVVKGSFSKISKIYQIIKYHQSDHHTHSQKQQLDQSFQEYILNWWHSSTPQIPYIHSQPEQSSSFRKLGPTCHSRHTEQVPFTMPLSDRLPYLENGAAAAIHADRGFFFNMCMKLVVSIKTQMECVMETYDQSQQLVDRQLQNLKKLIFSTKSNRMNSAVLDSLYLEKQHHDVGYLIYLYLAMLGLY
ncbi:Hypothetical_protein [Hexamita inflata]|uniref:Hypothetical_protein n=1 Tax=Hexamita inflata TaxID=28002 RepID=A0AA86UMI1_9EUKA|nr:Hypothetical protein HINF_LOCUS44837 [Hexamita inflata]